MSSALAEALLAAQRQAVASLSKAYVAGRITTNELASSLDLIGLRDDVDQGLLIHALGIVVMHGGEAPKATGQANDKPDPATEPASQKQLDYLFRLADEKGFVAPDGPLTKARASEAISALQAGTYNADEWAAPF